MRYLMSMQTKHTYRATFTDAQGKRFALRIPAAHVAQARIIAKNMAKRNGWAWTGDVGKL
jgi:hypothetical protein